jgi:hypothetical protein
MYLLLPRLTIQEIIYLLCNPLYLLCGSWLMCSLLLNADVEMSDGAYGRSKSFLKPIGSISKKKVQLHLKIKKDKRKARKKGRFGKK